MMRTALLLLALAACTKDQTLASPPPPKTIEVLAAPKGDTPRIDTKEYTVSLNARANGGEIIITAKPPLHLNSEYPAAFRPEAGGAKFSSEKISLTPDLRKPCAATPEDTCEASAPLVWEGGSGSQVAGTVQFSVCEPDKCLIEKARLAATVQ